MACCRQHGAAPSAHHWLAPGKSSPEMSAIVTLAARERKEKRKATFRNMSKAALFWLHAGLRTLILGSILCLFLPLAVQSAIGCGTASVFRPLFPDEVLQHVPFLMGSPQESAIPISIAGQLPDVPLLPRAAAAT